MDPLGRFLFLRNTTVAGNVAWADTAVYPYSIDPATGAVTANNVTTTVLGNSGSDMIVDPSGRYAYLVGSFNYVPEDRRIDAFAIDPTSGDLTANGPGVVTPGSVRQVAIDSGGRFVFAANVKPAGTYDASQVWCDGSTFTIGGAGPTEGQISGPGNACSIGSTDTWVIALVE
jgi:6-phosphogluconolactonase (cycloisomerase 2 family)